MFFYFEGNLWKQVYCKLWWRLKMFLFWDSFYLQGYIIIFQNVLLAFVTYSLGNHQIKGPGLVFASHMWLLVWFLLFKCSVHSACKFLSAYRYQWSLWSLFIGFWSRYQILGIFLLIQLCIIAAEGLRRSNLSSIATSVHHASLGSNQTSSGWQF